MKQTVSNEENNTKAAIGSLIVHALLLAFLIFYTFPASEFKEEAVIQLDWGGGGDDAAAGDPAEAGPLFLEIGAGLLPFGDGA